ncbi:MAG TPA: SMI1/KNR4 family protein [Ktedonobacteraceae bacterium]|jgi:cell wall assembly regulator SMI1|nr:SMI1/KNR4 family protein [Ktedonobacteraceae bacterium]
MIQELWDRIIKMLHILAPEIWLSIQPGASESVIRQAEETMEMQFPEEVKAFYRMQNGMAERWFEGAADLSEEMQESYHLSKNPQNIEGIIDTYSIGSLEQISRSWESLKEDHGYNTYIPHLDTGIFAPYEWHPKWFPFMGNIFASSYCIDLAPGPMGQMGQVLHTTTTSHGKIEMHVVAPNLQIFLATLAQDLEAGKYHFDETTGVLWSQKMLSTVSSNMLIYLKELRQRGKHGGPLPQDASYDWP